MSNGYSVIKFAVTSGINESGGNWYDEFTYGYSEQEDDWFGERNDNVKNKAHINKLYGFGGVGGLSRFVMTGTKYHFGCQPESIIEFGFGLVNCEDNKRIVGKDYIHGQIKAPTYKTNKCSDKTIHFLIPIFNKWEMLERRYLDSSDPKYWYWELNVVYDLYTDASVYDEMLDLLTSIRQRNGDDMFIPVRTEVRIEFWDSEHDDFPTDRPDIWIE